MPGDLVVGARVVAYDSVKITPGDAESHVRMWYLRDGVQQRVESLSAAPHLLAAAQHAAIALEDRHEPWPIMAGWPAATPHRGPLVFTGLVASPTAGTGRQSGFESYTRGMNRSVRTWKRRRLR